jgi:hypothetical protein
MGRKYFVYGTKGKTRVSKMFALKWEAEETKNYLNGKSGDPGQYDVGTAVYDQRTHHLIRTEPKGIKIHGIGI